MPARAALNHVRSFAVAKAGGKVTGVQGSRGYASGNGSADLRQTVSSPLKNPMDSPFSGESHESMVSLVVANAT